MIGSPAPDFGMPAGFRGRPVVLFFYPKDFTSICTAEACAFRDAYAAFREAGAEVVGISKDGADSHRRFAEGHRLPYLLLSDPDGEIARRYGVLRVLGILPGRATFVIDKDGILRHRFVSAFRAGAHVREALKALQALR